MAINCYTGLMGSGKSYEVVSSIIIPAVAQGRRVVTNISGVDNDGIRAYCCEKFDVPLDKLGSVVYAKNEEVASKEFFPTDASGEDTVCKSLVLPGDLVAVDEAYKIWGQDCKILNEHKVFFREHRHYTHPQSGVACDLVLMTQDIGDLHRMLKVVIEQSFRCHKAKGVGLNNVYTISMWEGWKQHAKTMVKDWTQTYNSEIFPLYKSYAGEQKGKEATADARQNIFKDRKFVVKIVLFLLVAAFILWRLIHWWWVKTHPEEQLKTVVTGSAPADKLGTAPSLLGVSSEWRIAGVVVIEGKRQIVLAGPGHVRLDDALMYIGDGLRQSGSLDGQKVSRYSGQSIVQRPSK